jgi:hypothetical protein
MQSKSPHLTDDCLYRYHLGQITDEAELREVEAHLFACSGCLDRANSVENCSTILRIGLVAGA